MPTLARSADAMMRTAPLYERVKTSIPPIEWAGFATDIDAIIDLKRARNAVILAHNYQTPEIFHCVADIVGDSLALAREATKAQAKVIVLAGVHFMGRRRSCSTLTRPSSSPIWKRDARSPPRSLRTMSVCCANAIRASLWSRT
jgi:hypothetical protein